MDLPKCVLVGEVNPYGSDDYFALYPAPDGSAGHRLCCMILGMRRNAYLDAFVRTNLCRDRWRVREAREEASKLVRASAPGGRFVLCGAKVTGAFGLEFEPFVQVSETGGRKFLVLPHPSGLCRLWNEPGAFRRAREAVSLLCPEHAGIIGVE